MQTRPWEPAWQVPHCRILLSQLICILKLRIKRTNREEIDNGHSQTSYSRYNAIELFTQLKISVIVAFNPVTVGNLEDDSAGESGIL